MPFYPFYEKLRETSQSMNKGNFGLWYNKLVPLKSPNNLKASDDSGDENSAVKYYFEKYKAMKEGSTDLLRTRHREQQDACKAFRCTKFEIIEIKARLKSPLITGIGETHPTEISMVFDHNIGIPYIPASSVKGIVRFAHTLSLIPEADRRGEISNGEFNDEKPWTLIPMMFGTQKNRGRIIFLDAYPEKVPDLHVDIMNPHYGPYYGDEKKPPADYHQPNPIKFLTVKEGNVFVFRAIAEKDNGMAVKAKYAFKQALTEEGVGAKTAVGYGRFEIVYIEGEETVKLAGGESTNAESQENGDVQTLPDAIIETWEEVYLSWSPGNQLLTAASKDRKATVKGKDLVPPKLHKALFEKRKAVNAKVTVERMGTGYRIVGIIEPQ